jgi:hypothetical protein
VPRRRGSDTQERPRFGFSPRRRARSRQSMKTKSERCSDFRSRVWSRDRVKHNETVATVRCRQESKRLHRVTRIPRVTHFWPELILAWAARWFAVLSHLGLVISPLRPGRFARPAGALHQHASSQIPYRSASLATGRPPRLRAPSPGCSPWCNGSRHSGGRAVSDERRRWSHGSDPPTPSPSPPSPFAFPVQPACLGC